MVNKRYLLLAGLCSTLVAQPVFAQESQSATPAGGAQWSARDMTYRGQNYDVLDTAYIPKKSMAQHKKFLNHQYAFPARPRNMWEVGFGIGQPDIIGSIPALLFYQAKGGDGGFNLNVRKAWGYMFSTRLQYIYGIAKGLDYRGTPITQGDGAPWLASNVYSNSPSTLIYNNYRTESHSLNLDFMLNTNNIKFNRARTSVSFYGYLGLGGFAYKTRINTTNNGAAYDFASIVGTTSTTSSNENKIRKALQSGMDQSYDQPAKTRGSSATTIFDGKILDFAPSVGAGAQFRLNKRMNLQLEERLTYPNGDGYVTGINYLPQQSVTTSNPVPTRASDLISYTSIGLNFNLGNPKKRVEPLYWLNPLDFSYNELNYPRHMLLPDPVLPDADGDGITDQFDKCPGTPAGVSVDSHGCPMDTDGDGVPDFRDKQLITPTECQPVDADGVGKCPCPEGCGAAKASQCGNIGAGSIIFPTTSAHISSAMQSQLATLAAQMQANPDCHVVITGAGNGNKLQQQRSWDRVNAVIQYMSEKNGINRNRFIFQYGQSGDANVVMYRSANVGEEGPATVAPPFPNLKTGDK